MQPIHIFKAGKQTASNGTTIVFTEADLAATANAYDPSVHEAPLVIGHPEQEDPAYGWISQLAAQAGNLYATPSQVNTDFAEMVKAGAYKKVSASFYPPEHPNNPTPGVYALRHVGFLGAQPPAVKGLKATQFADAVDSQPLVHLELDFADALVDPTIDPPEPIIPPTPELENTVTPEAAAALQAQNEALAAQLTTAQTALQAQAATANTAEHAAFAETLVAGAKVPASIKAFLVATLDHLEPPVVEGAPAFASFGEGEAVQTLAAGFKGFLTALPERVAFGEQATRDRAVADAAAMDDTVRYAEGTPPDQIDLDKRIRAFAKEHKLGYSEAAGQVAMQSKKTQSGA